MLRTVVICISLFLIVFPVSGSIITFIPESGSISSLEVMDIAESHDGVIVFATTNGLSFFDHDWATIQESPWEYDTGLQDNFITTIEYDKNNVLWLGFSAGLQIYDGINFIRVGEDEIFSTMDIHDILRDDDTIWIANGNSGLNHLSDGKWEWIRPFTENGPGAYYITSLAKDHETGNIILTSRFHGIWKGVSTKDGMIFSQIPFNEEEYGVVSEVVDYPFGGVILFNKNNILHYSEKSGITLIADTNSLGYGVSRINDVALTEDGIYVIGTNNGLYGFQNDEIITHITRNSNEITDNEATKVFADSNGRWWFITKGEAGYYIPEYTMEIIPVIFMDYSNTDAPVESESSNPLLIPVHYT